MKIKIENGHEFSSPINLSIPIEQTEEEKAKFEEVTEKLLKSKKATINVGGNIHSVLWETIEKIPHSRLAISGVDNHLLFELVVLLVLQSTCIIVKHLHERLIKLVQF